MLDSLIIHIPMRSEFVKQTGNLYSIVGDVADYQILARPSYFKRDLVTGEITHGDLSHPYESLPSAYSGMAIKFNAVNVANTYPYISLNASAKLLQGHNVYGGESVKNLSSEMLALLQDYYPAFFACLDLTNAAISRIDSTYSCRLPHERLLQPCLRFLSNVSNGLRRTDKDRRDFYNSVYWGGATSRHGNAVAYGKAADVDREVNELKKKAARGCGLSESKLQIFTPELIEFSRCLLRFEARTKKRKLEALGIPSNLWHFIRYQEKNRDVLKVLWRLWFDPILQALQGEIMDNYDDSEIYDLCRRKLASTTKSGRISYTKANNAFNFYQLLKMNGMEDVKGRYSPSQFYNLVKCLVDDVGISKSLLQNLDKQDSSFPMVELVKFDFSNQFPADYLPPVSAHIHKFERYLRPNLKLVS